MLLLGAALGGLMGSPHCVGMCGPFAAANDGVADQVGYHGGRLTAYAVLGALAGGLGSRLPPLGGALPWILDGVLVLMALRLAGVAAAPHLAALPGVVTVLAAAAKAPGWMGRAMFGAATALLPCGMLWAALALPIASGSAATGALAMVAFGLGTAPILLGLSGGIRGLLRQGPAVRWAMAGLVLASGLWAVHGRGPLTEEGAPSCHHGG